MGGKCCTTLVHGSIPVVKEATQALVSEYALPEAGPTLLPRACWCADLNRDADSKSFMQVPVSTYAMAEDDAPVPNGFSADLRSQCTGDLGAQRSVGETGPTHPEQQEQTQSRPQLKRSASGVSTTTAGSGVDYDNMSESQKHREAKHIIKVFVTGMVKGKEVVVVAPTGEYVDCILGLTRSLGTLKIKPAWPKDAQARKIALSSVDEILVGTDTGYSQMETPLDEFCVTLVLTSADCVTFRMTDVESRDTLAACLAMFCNEARSEVTVEADAPK